MTFQMIKVVHGIFHHKKLWITAILQNAIKSTPCVTIIMLNDATTVMCKGYIQLHTNTKNLA